MEQKIITVGKIHSTIELNGKKYNAHTGAPIDGVHAVKLHSNLVASHPPKQPSASRAYTPSKKIHKTTQPSRTLMRHAVKKPSTIINHSTVAMDVIQQGQLPAVASHFHSTDLKRMKRAESVRQLPTISRFGTFATTPAAAKLPVAKESVHELLSRPNASSLAQQQLPGANKSHQAVEKGLREATSHEHRAAKKPRLHHRAARKLGLSNSATNLVAGGFAILLFSGFFAYQNVPSLSVRYASAKAGVRASLPGYRPAGFAVSKRIQYSPGQITIAYKANADSRSYSVSQKNTSWNSEALYDHLVVTRGTNPQSFPDKGRTIYLHDGDQADWVNNGVWYSISGDSDLNTDQLIKIAKSI